MADYSPRNYTPTWGSVIIDSGFAAGTFINVEFDEDEYTATVGADGSVSVTENHSKLATITITLSQTAVKNAEISAVLKAAQLAKVRAEAPFFLADKGGTTVLAASKCWLKKRPPITAAKEHGDRTWTFNAIVDEYFVGGD